MEEKESEQNWAAISIASSSWSCNVENQVKCYRGSPTHYLYIKTKDKSWFLFEFPLKTEAEEKTTEKDMLAVTSSNNITRYSVGKSRVEPAPSLAVRR